MWPGKFPGRTRLYKRRLILSRPSGKHWSSVQRLRRLSGRDFGLRSNTLSIATLAGRKEYKIQVYKYARRYFDESWKYLASKLCKHKNGSYFLHLACEKEAPDKEATGTFMGIDVGINCLAVASTTGKKCIFFAGGESKESPNMSDPRNDGDFRKQAVDIWALGPV